MTSLELPNATLQESTPLQLHPEMELTTEDVEDIARFGRTVEIGEEATSLMEACGRTLDTLRDRGDLIYGLTTGFGPLAHESVDREDIELLQKNLVYHLASGTGDPMKKSWARGVMVSRAVCLSRGHSAVHPSTVELLTTWLNENITPAIPRFGTVGASGDLTPLAHLALAMMGEGEVLVDGARQPAQPLLTQKNIPALTVRDRDGLAIVNGTSAMTALAALAQQRGRRALDRAVELSALYADCMGAHTEAYSAQISRVRPHPGQRRVATALRENLADSTRVLTSATDSEISADTSAETRTLPQDAYSLRCLPQLLGAVDDMLSHHKTVVTVELNSVTDNPIFDPHSGTVTHGGNFFGQHVAFVSDSFNQSITALAVLAERQIARITDPTLSRFPAFLQPHRPGVQSGLMGAQVTASSLVARLRSINNPLSILSMPTNANNQDVNPMGTLAALRSHEILDRTFEILAILALSVAQGYFLEKQQSRADSFSSASRTLAEALLSHVDPIVDDRPLHRDIQILAARLDSNTPHPVQNN